MLNTAYESDRRPASPDPDGYELCFQWPAKEGRRASRNGLLVRLNVRRPERPPQAESLPHNLGRVSA
jgi:hypothetical protein